LGKKPSRKVLRRLYISEARSIREIANLLACTKEMVHRSLKEYGIKTRTNASRSQLRTIPLPDLEAGIKAKGIRRLARDLGLDEGTIRHYLKTYKARE
jgi:predicted transcriptional regulator